MKLASKQVIPRLLVVLVLLGLTIMSNVPRPQKSVAAPTSNPNKITICHRTHATTNPYRRITVNVSSIFNGNGASSLDDPQANGNGHGRFQHNDWIESEAWLAGDGTKARPVPNVFNPDTNYPSNKKRWGDIIPDVKVSGQQANRTAAPLNYDPGNTSHAGYAIYHNLSYNGDSRYAGLCKRMTAKQFCDAEIAALVAGGTTQSVAETTCMQELAEQDALDDAPLKTACAGDLSTCSVSKLSVYGTSTGSASCSNGVITLNGSTNMSTLSGEASFQIGTSASFGTTLTASPLTVTGAASFTATYNVPADGTYYYKAVVTTTDGNESLIEGGTVSIAVSGSNCNVTGAENPMPTQESTTTTSPATTTTTTPVTTTTTAPASTTTTTPATTTTTAVPTTSTTAPASTTTTTDAPVNSNSVGELIGTVWIDADEDDTKDPTEIWIPGIVITLTGPINATATTSSSGGFSFSNLAPGSYTVTATFPSGTGLRRTWDSQGSVDWIVTVTVVVGQTARADFAANGTMNVIGRLSTPPRGTPLEVDWSGLDDDLDTPDDQTYLPPVNSDGSFTITNVPTGRYRVRTQSVRANFTVTAAGSTYNSASISVEARPAVLPTTGTSSTPRIIPVAFILLPLGFIAALTSRRRRLV